MTFSNLFSLKNRTALITGGSRGIGRMIAQGFLAQGARVYISARKKDACDQAALEMAKDGYCISLPYDVSTVPGCQNLALAYSKFEDSLDILVNNAGAAWGEDFDDFPEGGWDKVMNLNVKSPFFLTQALHEPLKKAATNKVGKIINISSTDGIGLNPQENYSYVASKAGIIHLTRRMAMRLAKDNIAVSSIAPGAFPSEMNRNARDNGEELSKFIPASRIGTAEDIAGAAIFLASRAGDYVMGSTVIVDGGVTHARPYR